jgi:hypothetical protein
VIPIAWRRVSITLALFAVACSDDPTTAPPVLARLELSYTSRIVTVRQQMAIRVTAYESSNRRMKTPVVEWTSDDSLTATVDPTGRITGHRIGAVVIRAASGDVRTSLEIMVRPARLQITLLSGSEDLLVGGRAALIAEYLDASGQPVPGHEDIRWSMADTGVVRMDSASNNPMQREFAARATGLATISAFAMGVEGRFVIAVVSPPERNPPVEVKDFHIAQTWGIWDDLILVPALRVAVSSGRSVQIVRVDVAVAMPGPYYPSLCSSTRLVPGEHELLGAESYPTDNLMLRWYELPVVPRGVALLTYREGEALTTKAVREPVTAGQQNVTAKAEVSWTPCSSRDASHR